MPPHPNDWYDWGAFAHGAARAFWASPYMSEVENLAEDSRQERNSHPRRAEALYAAYKALHPSPGGRWEAVLPDVPKSAERAGKAYARKVRDVLSDEDLQHVDDKISDPEDAGYYAAMEALGHGVGWGDYGVNVHAPDWPDWDPKIQDDVWKAIRRGIRDAGITIPRRRK